MIQLCAIASRAPAGLPPPRRVENPRRKALGLDAGHDLIGMRRIARFQHDLEFRPLGRHVEEHAPVRDLEDIGAKLAQESGDVAENARIQEGIRQGLEDMRAGRTSTLDEFKAHVRAKHGIKV